MSINIKIIRSSHARRLSESKADILLDAVNAVVSGLPMGHKDRNDKFARKILSQVYEIFLTKEDITEQEVKRAIYKITKGTQIL